MTGLGVFVKYLEVHSVLLFGVGDVRVFEIDSVLVFIVYAKVPFHSVLFDKALLM
jgi:hypothetical protein